MAGCGRCSSSPRGTPTRGEEVFLAPAVRSAARGDKHAVSETRFLWVDVDQPGRLPALWAFLAERPCHLLVESGGSGGAHAYWKLDRAAAGDARDRVDRRAGRADRARATCGSSTTSGPARTASRTSPTRRARSARG